MTDETGRARWAGDMVRRTAAGNTPMTFRGSKAAAMAAGAALVLVPALPRPAEAGWQARRVFSGPGHGVCVLMHEGPSRSFFLGATREHAALALADGQAPLDAMVGRRVTLVVHRAEFAGLGARVEKTPGVLWVEIAPTPGRTADLLQALNGHLYDRSIRSPRVLVIFPQGTTWDIPTAAGGYDAALRELDDCVASRHPGEPGLQPPEGGSPR